MGLKVVKLVAENIKGLKAIEIIPDENFQIIAGKNGQGKTSVLDTIMLALGGASGAKGTVRPIRDGSDSAIATLDMGDFIVTRKWSSNDKSTLQVISKEGAKFSSPQKMLDELIGRLSFDPLAFSNLDTKDQLKTLLDLLNVDPTSIDLQKKQVFEERTLVNREVKNLKSQLEALPSYDDTVPNEELQPADVLREMAEAQEALTRNNELRNKYTKLGNDYHLLKNEIERDETDITRLETQLADLKRRKDEKTTRLQDMAQEGSDLQAAVQSLQDPDLGMFNQKLAEVDEINKKVRAKVTAKNIESQYKQVLENSKELTGKLATLDEEKQKLISGAKFPIEGLSFDETGVLYNGIPFKQCSAAERLRVSMAMAMSLNPQLKVIRILDGSLLDSTNMKLIEDMARDQDYQVWVEIVDESGQVGITIEDGLVVN